MKKDEKGRIVKGNIPWNKGLKGLVPWNKGVYGYMRANRTSFTRETIKKQPSGTPYKTRDGYACLTDERALKKDPRRPNRSYMCRKKIPYSHWVLKKAGVEIPAGYVVYHVDGDKFNDDITNLEVISRAELIKRNRK